MNSRWPSGFATWLTVMHGPLTRPPSFDFRQFKHLEMFVHAEQSIASQNLKYGDLTIFVRIGSDFTQNFYEYEIPLTFTAWDVTASQSRRDLARRQ